MESILNVKVSRFANYNTPGNPATINLLDWLTSDAYRPEMEQIRQLTDKQQRDEVKATLPAITPSAVCSYRKESAVLHHSGFIQFDIDFKDNQHITNYAGLKQQIIHIQNVAYCGLSASGTGYWGLIPIAYPDKHRYHFKAIQQAFNRLRIKIDEAPKNVASLRGYSYDNEAYFNHTATPLQRYEVPPRPPETTYTANPTNDQVKVEICLTGIEARKIDLTSSYPEWFEIGCSLSGTFGEQGRDYYHRVSQFHPDYDTTQTDKVFDKCIKAGYNFTIALFFNRCASVGIRYVESVVRLSDKSDKSPAPPKPAPEPAARPLYPDSHLFQFN